MAFDDIPGAKGARAEHDDEDLAWADAELVEVEDLIVNGSGGSAASSTPKFAVPLALPSAPWSWGEGAPPPASKPLPAPSASKPTAPLTPPRPAHPAPGALSLPTPDRAAAPLPAPRTTAPAPPEEPRAAASRSGTSTALEAGPDFEDGPRTAEPVTVPPARVVFSAPLLLQRDDEQAAFNGSVLNLSTGGLGCVAPVDLAVGSRVWASFVLAEGDQPITAMTDVVWRSEVTETHRTYGLRFRRLGRLDEELLREAVRERADAGALGSTAPSNEAAGAPSSASWLSLGMGLAAGIALTVLLGALFGPGAEWLESFSGEQIAAVPETEAPALAGARPVLEGAAPAPAPAGLAAAAVHEAADTLTPSPPFDAPSGLDGAPVPETPKAPAEPDRGSTAVREEAPDGRGESLAGAPASTDLPRLARTGNAPHGDLLPSEGGEDRASMLLWCDGPVEQHVSFWLTSPRRLVIDVPNRRSGFDRIRYRIDHPLAQQLRVGNHPGKVRFVIETAEDVSPEVVATAQGDALSIELRRGAPAPGAIE